ncbi:imidazole glycerol phosphate synthase subunit HisF [Oceanispirochaeta sp.]|jgi:cyclase|uniref:imidazole glycerol phosphate synthase subunit HisF n=1 Tax=Oceanispirochaeta sp. TaxID=2035350 RepID=UPI00262605A4|nr:imidazole glycerol phosphate synthase subunit HisF [Oceanispirochaeta sp.]MDA3955231.1 imidazole glycerol phosphate synthase subunit HisF [Oceanispirochaeta sp.]
MLQKRIVVCLDVRDGKTTKGIKFQGNVDIGDPVERAAYYYQQGVDELVFYDITASSEKRGIMIDVVSRVARTIFIPFCVGGGISTLEDMKKVIGAGAEKVSLNSAAVRNPQIINQGARHFGNQCIVLGMDALADPSMPSGYRVVIDGGRKHTERDALAWALEAESRGAGEIVVNSIDADGTREGYELILTRLISESVGIPVVASGGAGQPEHLADVLTKGKADAALIASMVHFGDFTLAGIKAYLHDNGIPVRL